MNNNILIYCAYAENESMQSGENIKKVSDRKTLYLKNSFVALYSVKATHPEVNVALITNIKIPKLFFELFTNNGIDIIYQEFDSFLFDKNMKWGLAFYKLCALKMVLEKNYKYYLMLDTDIVVQNSMNDMFTELKDYILLYERFVRSSYEEEKLFDSEVQQLINEDCSVIKYGGEFIGGPQRFLIEFICECENIYKRMIETKICSNFGDEFIICIASRKFRNRIKEANAYIERYWTGTFRQVNINYLHNPVSILHVPAEKSEGMIKIYEYIIKHNTLPEAKLVHRFLHLKHPSLKTKVKIVGKKVLNKQFLKEVNKWKYW